MKKLRIIVFEDDKSLANLIEQVLQQKGHDVEVFSDPTLCRVYRDHDTGCPKNTPCADVIISDQKMPNMSGLDFLKLQKMRGCKTPGENKVLLTGSTMDAGLKCAINELGCHCIKKPFKIAEILTWVDECAERVG